MDVIVEGTGGQAVPRHQLLVKVATGHHPLEFVHNYIVFLVGRRNHVLNVALLFIFDEPSIITLKR